MTTNKHGGTRIGAGKPKATTPTKLRSIRLNDDDWVKFREIGGVKWLRRMIKNLGVNND